MKSNQAPNQMPWLVWILCITIWLFMSTWSAWNVGDGIHALQFYKDRPLWSSYGLAIALQSSVAVSSVLIPILWSGMFGWRSVLPSAVLLLSGITLIAFIGYFETKHSVLYVVKNGMASEVRDNAIVDLQSMNAQLDAISALTSNRYQTRVDELGKLSSDAGRGLDETGIATCGPNCNNYRLRQQLAREQYADLRQLSLPILATTNREIPTLISNISERLLLAQAKLERLNQFLLTEQSASRAAFSKKINRISDGVARTQQASLIADISPVIEGVSIRLSNKIKKYGTKASMSERDFAINEVEEVYAALWNGTLPAAPFVWALMYALAPFCVSLFFGMVIGRYRPRIAYATSESIETELATEMANEETLEKLVEIKRRNWLSRLRAKFFDREPNMPVGMQPAV